MSFEDQAKGAMDQVVSGPGSEPITYYRHGGSALHIRASIDRLPGLLGDAADYGPDPVTAYVSRSDLPSVVVGRDQILTDDGRRYRVAKAVQDDPGGFALYLVP